MKKLLCRTSNLIQQQRKSFSQISKFGNNFLSITNIAYIEAMYENWKKDKSSVSPSLSGFFELIEKGQDPQKAFSLPPKLGQKMLVESGLQHEVRKQLGVRMMIDRFRAVAHQFAKTDPLQLGNRQRLPGKIDISCLNISEFGFNEQTVNQEITLKYLRQQHSDKINGPYNIKALHEYLQKIYMGNVGYQYMHLNSKEQRDFLKASIEKYIEILMVSEPTKQERYSTFRRLCKDQCFIDFMMLRFTNTKRFGIEGLNSFTSSLGKLVQVASQTGCQNIVIGMAHRGRLNALHCVLDKPAQHMFKEFLQISDEDLDAVQSGDVKYHLGYRSRKNIKGNPVYLRMLPNPSHLQTVSPLVHGAVRAIQQCVKDKQKSKAMGVIMHGDAAVTGQGIVYEALQFQDLVDYSTGGIIHIVMNNQLGFTTPPWQGRSSYYCTQIAKTVGAPVIHVNADQPDILDGVMHVAVAYRQKFKKDIFIEIVGYRRYGHSQQDQPLYTHPIMYEKIKHRPSVFELYSKKCIQKGVLTQQQIDEMKKQYMQQFEKDLKKVVNDKIDAQPQHEDPFNELEKILNLNYKTGVPKNILLDVFKKVTTLPIDFNVHPTIKKIFDERVRSMNQNQNLDWATMESLAFATLLHEGYGVRLSGQDVERGTFSHRHAFVSDQQKDVEKLNFFKSVNNQKVTICNSHLSQYGVCGYEWGYSITNPNVLVIWEAQFGDFANGAQIIIDNYLAPSQSKWRIQSGLVLNLPHGMDGQGPEHSSGRMERFLFLSDDNCDVDQSLKYHEQLQKCNIQIVSCSTSSNYFHVLRRQLRRDFRKPLINFNSKKLLKFKGANRPIEEITQGTEFQPIIPDNDVKDPKKIKRVLLCNGQFFYDLKSKRDQLKHEDIAIVRIQQLAPFPHQKIKQAIQSFDKDVSIQWAQQQHENYGAWYYLCPRLKKLFNKQIKFHGRKPSAATAAGALKLHKLEEAQLMQQIFPSLKNQKKSK